MLAIPKLQIRKRIRRLYENVARGSRQFWLCGACMWIGGLGIGPGDEVIVPAYTWIGSAQAVIAVGAVPILAEIDVVVDSGRGGCRTHDHCPHQGNHGSAHARRSLPDARARALAQRRGLKVLEDVAQAVGGSFDGQCLGSIGDVGAFSFQFNKIITCGEGGIAITQMTQKYTERIIMYHDGGAAQRKMIPAEKMLNGLNYRMSELHGAIMLVQLRRLQGLLKDLRERKATLKDAIKT